MSIKNIAFIGLGAMGTPMVTFLLRAGYNITGFDIVKRKMTDLVPLGLKAAKSLRESLKGADLIMLSLKSGSDERSNWEVVREVVEGKNGMGGALRRGQIVVDTSTVPPWETRAMGARLARRGIEWMDIPVSGAAFQAREGNMVFMAGGKISVFRKVKPVLDKVGKKVIYAGKNGAGAQLKLVVNQTLFLNQAAAIEGFVHGLKGGLNPEVMYDVLVSGAAGSDLIAARGKAMLAGEFGKYGTVRGLLKDMDLALESGRRLGVMLPMMALYHQLLLQAYYSGWEKEDATVVMRLYEQLAGIDGKTSRFPSTPQDRLAVEPSGGRGGAAEIRHIGVVGLGQMGTPMTTFLLKAGFDVAGYDLVEKQVSDLVPLGLRPAKSPKEAAMGADLVLLSLPNWGAVQSVVEGEDGILRAARPGLVIMDASTVEPWETKAMAERLARMGIEWMDVPVSGSAAQARVGNMVFMAGGKKSIFERIKPVLDKVGKKTVFVGKNGDAALLKLVVNQILYLNQASAIEGFVHGLKGGLTPEVILDGLASGAAGSGLITARGKDMLTGNFEKKGPVWLALKTFRLILNSAERLGVILPMLALYQQLLLQAHYNGWDDNDLTIIMRIYEKLAGIRF
jgi:3-hydroxyisobutyrate dehydrogenase-like beta-hydroxyacid dehydrogenase